MRYGFSVGRASTVGVMSTASDTGDEAGKGGTDRKGDSDRRHHIGPVQSPIQYRSNPSHTTPAEFSGTTSTAVQYTVEFYRTVTSH